MKKLIVSILILGALLFYSRTIYSPYTWRVIRESNKIKMIIYKRLALDPYIGCPIYEIER